MRTYFYCLNILALLAGAWIVSAAGADSDDDGVISIPAPDRLDFEVEERLEPGLIVEFAAPASGLPSDFRTARLPSLLLSAAEPPTPFLPPGAFTTSFRGYLYLDVGGTYAFHVAGRGAVTMRINGEEVLRSNGSLAKAGRAAVELYSDYTPIEIAYESMVDGAAELRINWERLGDASSPDAFAVEPLPPSILWHDPQDVRLARSQRLRRGRELFANLNCLACHTLGDAPEAGGGQMAEVARVNPDLAGVAGRFERAWLFHWIADPASLRNHVTMPQVFGREVDVAERPEIADLIAYLQSLPDDSPPLSDVSDSTDKGLVRAGEILYENLGCIACHRFTPPADDDYYKRTTLHAAAAKYRPGALTAFLLAPHAHYPNSRMPDFRLSPEEAIRLAAFIRSRSAWRPPDSFELPAGDADKGKAVFQARGCNACHATATDEQATSIRTPLAAIANTASGCFSSEANADGKAPVYSLDEEDREALREFLVLGQGATAAMTRHVPVEASRRLVERLRCSACHTRDGQFSVLSEVILEEGVQGLPVVGIPELTWAGEKLQRDWTVQLLKGRLDYRARPWLKARMPSFPAYAEPLATGLPREHGFTGELRPRPEYDAELAEIGNTLSQQFTGFYCTECHAAGGRPPSTAFDHRGIDFPYVAERLQYDYYHRWMRDPQRIDPSTKMPQFAKQPKPDIQGGSAEKQFDALWHYLQSFEQ